MNGDQHLRQQWAEIDFDAVGLWRHLLRWDYRRAAVGLLQDLFKELHDAETRDDPEDQTPVGPEGRPMREHLIACYRERLMEILGDPDGTKLSMWTDLFAAYRYEEVDHERAARLQHAFLQRATELVEVQGNDIKAQAAEDDDPSEDRD
jgi:hypothetical protein